MSSYDGNMQDAGGGCLCASVNRVGDGMKVRITNAVVPLFVQVSDAGTHLDMTVRKATKDVKVSLYDAATHLNVKCSVVCSLAEIGDYLEVTPADIQWITDDVGVFFEVESNVDWIITID